MKKILLALVLCLLLVALVGCNPYTSQVLTDSSQEDAFFQGVLDILEAEDKDAFRPLFSAELAATAEFEGQMDAMFEYFQGEVASFSSYNKPVSKQNKEGAAYEIISASYLVKTDVQEYMVSYQRCVRNEKEPEIVGILSLNIQRAATEAAETTLAD